MADLEPDIVEENRLLERAIWRKWNKFTWSGLIYIVIGLLVIIGGLSLSSSPSSAQWGWLIVGLGVIVVIIGVIRLLIGIINPLSPDDLRGVRPPDE